jgi:hypothetical protein
MSRQLGAEQLGSQVAAMSPIVLQLTEGITDPVQAEAPMSSSLLLPSRLASRSRSRSLNSTRAVVTVCARSSISVAAVFRYPRLTLRGRSAGERQTCRRLNTARKSTALGSGLVGDIAGSGLIVGQPEMDPPARM